MLAQAGRYYGSPLKVYQGVNQGEPLSPIILNMVVDSLIRHWVTMVTGEEAGPVGFWRAVKCLEEFLYLDN